MKSRKMEEFSDLAEWQRLPQEAATSQTSPAEDINSIYLNEICFSKLKHESDCYR
jgi:hypothetical protein